MTLSDHIIDVPVRVFKFAMDGEEWKSGPLPHPCLHRDTHSDEKGIFADSDYPALVNGYAAITPQCVYNDLPILVFKNKGQALINMCKTLSSQSLSGLK